MFTLWPYAAFEENDKAQLNQENSQTSPLSLKTS